eukprot:c25836_g1_i1 orf=296-2623(-)
MAELNSVQRYASGALFALALHQAEIHRHSLTICSGSLSPSAKEGQFSSVEYDDADIDSWTSSHSCLLHPVFRYLNIDSKAWNGLEQTAVSPNAKHHINAFLAILSEREENASTSTHSNLDADLAYAVKATPLTLKESSILDDREENDKSRPCLSHCQVAESDSLFSEPRSSENVPQNSATMGEGCSNSFHKSNCGKDIRRYENILWKEEENYPRDEGNCKEEDSGNFSLHGSSVTPHLSSEFARNFKDSVGADTSLPASEGQPLLKENYFGTSVLEVGVERLDVERRPGGRDNENNVNTKRNGKLGDQMYDIAIVEGGRVAQQKKVAVLYELMAGSVADIPVEEEGTSRLRRGYDARQRVALRLLATWLDVKWNQVAALELMVAYSAMAAQEDNETNEVDDEKQKNTWTKWKRGGLIGAAALTGGTLLAITGGLAAPAIAAGLSALAPTLGTILPIIGSSGFAAAAAAAGTTAGSVAVAASFGAAGAGLTGSKMARRTGGVDEFGFEGVGENHQQGHLAVGILVSGFINDPGDFTKPWKGKDGDLERYALRWETKNLIAISTAIQDWLTSNITRELMKQGAMLTVLNTLVAALTWPTALLSLTDFIDSKWTVAVDRSDKAGKLLAKVLLKGLQGNRPVTLIGFSLGARVIFKCLEKLAEKGENGGIIERVVLLGAPLPLETERWETVRKVVAGRFVNGYSTNDWILGVIYRTSLLSQGLAGIQAVNVPGIENIDLTDIIKGHSSYLSKVPEIVHAINIDNYYPIFLPEACSSSSL